MPSINKATACSQSDGIVHRQADLGGSESKPSIRNETAFSSLRCFAWSTLLREGLTHVAQRNRLSRVALELGWCCWTRRSKDNLLTSIPTTPPKKSFQEKDGRGNTRYGTTALISTGKRITMLQFLRSAVNKRIVKAEDKRLLHVLLQFQLNVIFRFEPAWLSGGPDSAGPRGQTHSATRQRPHRPP